MESGRNEPSVSNITRHNESTSGCMKATSEARAKGRLVPPERLLVEGPEWA